MTADIAAARRLAEALTFPTVSRKLAAEDTRPAFEAFRAALPRCFPAVHAAAEPEEIGPEGALLYTLRGADPSLAPWLFISHQDVVDAPRPESWTHPPFSGTIANGHVWGRGALDVKVTIMAFMEALERMLRAGFRPRRGLRLAFGADEETGGERGAALIAETLRRRGERPVFSLDEGGIVSSGAVPGVDVPVAAVSIAEKGYLTTRFRSAGGGGHSSLPGCDAPAERLVAMLRDLSEALPPARLDGPVQDFLRAVAPHARPPFGFLYRYPETFSLVILRAMRDDPATAALTRTTAAITLLRAGRAENVTPGRAEATVNLRPLPGDGKAELTGALARLASRHGVELVETEGFDASPVSRRDTPWFEALEGALAEIMPDVVCAPVLAPNGTDSRHYETLAAHQYRFMPARLGPGDLERIHGVDERVSVGNYMEMIGVYEAFARRADAAETSRKEYGRAVG